MLPLHVQLQNSTLRGAIKRLHFPLETLLVCVHWYAAYALSARNLEEMMAERGVLVDHATVHRWALKMLPVLANVFRGRKHAVGSSRRIDETYVSSGRTGEVRFRCNTALTRTVWPSLGRSADQRVARL
jgi:putative transposase